MSHHLSPSTLARDFGLLEAEALRLAQTLEGYVSPATPRVSERQQLERRKLLAETNANLAIENLPLAQPELAFFHYIQQFALTPAAADTIHHAYSLARARSVAARAAE